MTPEEILGKFVNRRMMAKDARYINDIANGSLPNYNNYNLSLSKQQTARRHSPTRWRKLRWSA
jgi:hypothetical protein